MSRPGAIDPSGATLASALSLQRHHSATCRSSHARQTGDHILCCQLSCTKGTNFLGLRLRFGLWWQPRSPPGARTLLGCFVSGRLQLERRDAFFARASAQVYWKVSTLVVGRWGPLASSTSRLATSRDLWQRQDAAPCSSGSSFARCTMHFRQTPYQHTNTLS